MHASLLVVYFRGQLRLNVEVLIWIAGAQQDLPGHVHERVQVRQIVDLILDVLEAPILVA